MALWMSGPSFPHPLLLTRQAGPDGIWSPDYLESCRQAILAVLGLLQREKETELFINSLTKRKNWKYNGHR